MGNFGNHYAPRIGGLLEARCHVGRIADCCVVHSKITANASHDNQTCVDTLAHAKIDTSAVHKIFLIKSQGFLDPEGRMDGPLRMVLMRYWSAKEGHNAVAEELVNGSLVPMNLAQHKLECAIH
jgi:hypothetical protein